MKNTGLPLALGLVALAGGCTTPAPEPPAYAATLDQVVEAARQEREIPGMSLVVVEGDAIRYSRGFGMADLAGGRPMTDSTPTVIGSTSKPITALAVLRLVQEGRVALDTPIVRYLPDLSFADPRASAITLRHLLTNRAGFPVGFSGPAYQLPYQRDEGALDGLARQMAAEPLLFAPGEDYAYSNRGWALAGYIVQRVSGMAIEQFLAEEVFTPLGMTGTTLEFWNVPDLVAGYREGYEVRNHPAPASLTRAYGPAGMVVSTPRDMGRLLLAMLNGGRTAAGGQFLTPALIAEALRGQADAESELGGPTRYGLGWEVDSAFGTLTIKKAGSVGTMVTLWVMLPERNTAVAFSFNREDYGAIPLVPTVLSIIAGGDPVPFQNTPRPVAPAVAAAVPVPGSALASWLGSYDTRFGDLRVYRRADSLFSDFEGTETALLPAGPDRLTLTGDWVGVAGKTFGFRRGTGGRITIWLDSDSLGIRRPDR